MSSSNEYEMEDSSKSLWESADEALLVDPAQYQAMVDELEVLRRQLQAREDVVRHSELLYKRVKSEGKLPQSQADSIFYAAWALAVEEHLAAQQAAEDTVADGDS